MAFMKFSKGKKIYSVPNGIGDGSAYFSQTEGVIANVDNLPYGNSARTISAWIYISVHNTQDNDTFFSYGYDSANTRFGIGVNKDGGSINVWGRSNTTTYQYSFNLKQWYHAVITFAEDYTEQCYIDGVLIGTQTHANINTQKGGATVGRSANNSNINDWFYGNITDINVYNRVLSADEITTLYNKGTVADGLVLNVPLQYGKDDESLFSSKSFVYDYSIIETSSGFDEWGYPIRYDIASECGISLYQFVDSSTVFALNANKGDTELINGLTPTYNSGTCSEDSTFKFDGNNKWATYPTKGVSNVNLGTGPFTIEWDCSIGTNHNGTYPSFINMGAGWSTAGCYIIQWQRLGSGRFSSHWNGHMGQDCYPTDAFPQFNGDGLYHHVAITRADNGLYCFWVDGVRLSDTYTRTLPLDLSFANLDFGYNRIDGGRLQYDMKHFRISNECLYTEDFNVPRWVGN